MNTLNNIMHEMMTPNYFQSNKGQDVWVIGDVHGCGKQFKNILEQINEVSNDPLIFQLGDLIDRGPNLLSVFKLVEEYNVKTSIGNHETNFIQEYFNYKKCNSKVRQETHDKLNSYSKKDKDFIISSMLNMRNFYDVQTDSKNWLLSHAPFKKNIDIEHDCGNASSYCMSNEEYDSSPLYDNSVHGHMHWAYKDIEKQIEDDGQSWYNIDSGACYGNYLLALELNSLKHIKVH